MARNAERVRGSSVLGNCRRMYGWLGVALNPAGRRRTVTILLALVVLSSGCSMLSGPFAFTASPASACDEALSSTGYTGELSRWENVSRTLEVGGQSRNVSFSNYVNSYAREGPDGEGGTESKGGFAVFTTPQAQAAGQSVNPVRNWSPREMVENLDSGLDEYGSLQDLQQEGTDEVTTLGTTATRTRFTATGARDGDPVDVFVEVVRVEHGGDYVVLGSVYEQSNTAERSRLDRLYRCIQHEGTNPTITGTAYPTSTTESSPTPDDREELPTVTIEELNEDPERWTGERVRVRGTLHNNVVAQGEVDNSVLVENYSRVAQDRALPAEGTLPLDTVEVPPSERAEWSEGYRFELVGRVASSEDDNEETPEVELQIEEYDILGPSDYIRFVEVRNRIDPARFPELVYDRNECRFAVIMSGGINSANNHKRYWNDVRYTYKAMNGSFGLSDDQIFVHYFNGAGTGHATSVDGRTIVDDDASETAINDTFDTLESRVEDCGVNTELMVFTYNHGQTSDPEGKSLLGLSGDGSSLTPVELRTMFERVNEAGLDEGYVMMKQCYSGQFLNARNDQPNVDLMQRQGTSDPVVTAIGTAGKNGEVTYSTTGSDGVGPYGYHFVAALAGTYPNGTNVPMSVVDANGNGDISWKEAHDYSVAHERYAQGVTYNGNFYQEHPQFAGSTTEGPG
jgi:hypothetical protein